MKRSFVFVIMVAFFAACSTKEIDIQTPSQEDVVFYASFEQPAEDGTRVYANEDLLLRWTADDRITIFNKNTYNQQYRFAGETGDNAGGFDKVAGSEFATGNAISHVVSVYPYQSTTKISESESLTLTLPAEQHYAENSFGLGANTMVAVSEDNVLMYKNVGGYLRITLFGTAAVSSITLKGNNGEKLAGNATVTLPMNGVPSVQMANDATDMITLTCDNPVSLNPDIRMGTDFWFVIPPVTFEKGFTVNVTQASGGIFEISTPKSIAIERSNLSKMSPVFVKAVSVIEYSTNDGSIIQPNLTSGAFGAYLVSNEYVNGYGVLTFDGLVTQIGNQAFMNCTNLVSINIPNCIDYIGHNAFDGCSSLSSITIPDGVRWIGARAFADCTSLVDVDMPESVTDIYSEIFKGCTSLSDIVIPDSVTWMAEEAFSGCTNLKNVELPKYLSGIGSNFFSGCTNLLDIVLPEETRKILNGAFYDCSSLAQITIPDGVNEISFWAFGNCTGFTHFEFPESVKKIGMSVLNGCTNLISITVLSETPPQGDMEMFDNTNNCPIFVPAGSVDAYKAANRWDVYAERIRPLPEAVDLGLPSGLKWASFNLGASKPEEYGDYYAWGETEPYYSSQDPLVWKEGKEAGYDWSSYKWCNGTTFSLTKYCTNSEYGDNGFTDYKTVLDIEDDAAHVNLSGNWRMPTDTEWKELIENCTWTWTTQNGVSGSLVMGTNGNSIFFPLAGYRSHLNVNLVGSRGSYWSSSLTNATWLARYVDITSNDVYRNSNYSRVYGFSVRPVYDDK